MPESSSPTSKFPREAQQRVHQLITHRYPWFLETWDNYPFNIERADAIRYFVLAHYGGVYIDLDDVCGLLPSDA